MDKEKAIEILSLVAADLSAQHKEFGYDYERQELMDALELAVEELRKTTKDPLDDYERGMNVNVRDLRDCLEGLPNNMDVIIPVFDEHDENIIVGFRHVRTVGLLENQYEPKLALCLATARNGADMYSLMNYNKLNTKCVKGLF